MEISYELNKLKKKKKVIFTPTPTTDKSPTGPPVIHITLKRSL